MECETIGDFEERATRELRAALSEAGIERPECFRAAVAFAEPSGAPPAPGTSQARREAARYVAEVTDLPQSLFGVVEDQEAAVGGGGAGGGR